MKGYTNSSELSSSLGVPERKLKEIARATGQSYFTAKDTDAYWIKDTPNFEHKVATALTGQTTRRKKAAKAAAAKRTKGKKKA